MNHQLQTAGRAGEAPKFTKDYTPQKTWMINYISKLMSLPCDFILTGHLREKVEVLGQTKQGSDIQRYFYRFHTTGQAMVTIPLKFDELYVVQGRETQTEVVHELIVQAQGKYLARSRLKADGKLDSVEPADIRALLKKIGLDWKDKPKLDLDEGDVAYHQATIERG